ncbi:hypothetical protein [Allorhizocola rhizosphaerae]|uniref:hypothetical protein n=1 Tax=Allorhizocola rhizosphaerae TaxID=1872709 RepID=UPI000E3B84E7|nr:hypothetical protein [Allorhizocola rhizosphaerae]
MASIELSDGAPIAVPLHLRTERGRPTPPAELRADGRILIGKPQIRHLTADSFPDDRELSGFIASEASRCDYYLLGLSCTLISDEQESLALAWLRVNLISTGTGDDEPVAHSLDPLLLDEIRTLSYSVKLTVPCVITPEFAIQGERRTHQAAVTALGEGQSSFAWEFREIPGRPPHGVQRLRAVIRMPSSGTAEARIDAGATIRHRRLNMNAFSYFAPPKQLPDALTIVLRRQGV